MAAYQELGASDRKAGGHAGLLPTAVSALSVRRCGGRFTCARSSGLCTSSRPRLNSPEDTRPPDKRNQTKEATEESPARQSYFCDQEEKNQAEKLDFNFLTRTKREVKHMFYTPRELQSLFK